MIWKPRSLKKYTKSKSDYVIWFDMCVILLDLSYCNTARAASVQSFTLWQQATIEIMRRTHSIIACSCHLYMGVILRDHPVRGESHTQHNVNREVTAGAYSKSIFKLSSPKIDS